MANLLTDLEVHEISLVDKGASGDGEDRPRIVIAKREPVEKQMTLEEVLAGMPEEARNVVLMAIEEAAKPAEPMPAPEPEMPAEKMADEPVAKPEMKPEEEVAKKLEGVSPEARALVLEAIEKREELEKRVATLENEKTEAKFTEIAKSMDALPGMSTAQRAKLLRSASESMGAEDYAAVEKALRDAAETVKKSAALTEVGGAGNAPGNPNEKLAAIAKALREKDPTLTEASAKMKALANDPQLYAELNG